MSFVTELKLKCDPFARDAARPATPVGVAFEHLLQHFESGTTRVLVVGPPGSGKSLLLEIAEKACRERRIPVLRIERGDLVHMAIGRRADVLLVDEADFVDQPTLSSIAAHPQAPKILVLACRTPPIGLDVPALVKVAPLTPPQARDFVVERTTTAGRPDLFTPEALDSLIAGACGLPRLLRSIGALALFFAAYEGANQVGAEHVAKAIEGQSVEDQLGTEKTGLGAGAPEVSLPSLVVDVKPEPEGGRDPIIPTPVMAMNTARHESIPRRRNFVEAKAFATALLPLLLLNGSLGQEGHAGQSNPRVQIAPRRAASDANRGLERVARAAYHGPVILAVITVPALQSVPIAAEERTSAPVKKPLASPQLKPSAKKNPPRLQIRLR